MAPVSATFVAKQEGHYQSDSLNRDRLATPGSQYVMQLLRGGYLEDYSQRQGLKALDVGCGTGYNLVSFALLGWEAYGCEISPEIVEYARANTARFGCRPHIVVGENQDLPFPDAEFDFLLSENVIHYVDSRQGLLAGLAEYARVLKPGGRLLLQTCHPDNWILAGSRRLAANLYLLRRNDDFRDQEVFYVFQDEQELRRDLAPHFRELRIGVNCQEFFRKRIVNWVVTGLRR